jgi:hypothetical protein
MANMPPLIERQMVTRLVYLNIRRGLPTEARQRDALLAAGLTEAELADAYVDRGKPKRGEPAQPERAYIIGNARETDELWVARAGVLATTEADALDFLARLSAHGCTLCVASTGQRYHCPPEAAGQVADALRLVAAIKADEAGARMEIARRGRPGGKTGGKPKVMTAKLDAARAHWEDKAISGKEAAERSGISWRTLYRYFGPRETPRFGRKS